MRSRSEILRDREFIARLRASLGYLASVCLFGHMSQVEKAHAALIEGAEDFGGATVEYWSRVRDGARGPAVEIVLRVAERCANCHRSKCVFVIRPEGAMCKDCDSGTAVAQADGLPSADDLDADAEEKRIADETN